MRPSFQVPSDIAWRVGGLGVMLGISFVLAMAIEFKPFYTWLWYLGVR